MCRESSSRINPELEYVGWVALLYLTHPVGAPCREEQIWETGYGLQNHVPVEKKLAKKKHVHDTVMQLETNAKLQVTKKMGKDTMLADAAPEEVRKGQKKEAKSFCSQRRKVIMELLWLIAKRETLKGLISDILVSSDEDLNQQLETGF
ncbi:hypothetical protein BTVI_103251 [Pitangus sulphuratus]|nr:hypothetical protein BTVI_103251 [Pitangus sulphuratus]